MAETEKEYELLELTGDFGKTTRSEWESQLGNFSTDEDLMLKSLYLSRLDYAIDEDTDAIFYGLKGEDNSYAYAILELTVKMPETNQSGLRLLNINLEPNLDVENRHADHLDNQIAIEVIAQCIVKAFNLTFDQIPASTFKIYGRTDRMELILETVSKNIRESRFSDMLRTEIQGRWLLIEKKF